MIAGPPKKRSVQQASYTAPLTTTPTPRPDKVGQQWTTPTQRPDKVGQQWTTSTQKPDKVGQQWTAPTQRPDKVGQQWHQSQQRERQEPHHFKQNYPHENRYNGRTASVNVAATCRPQHVPVLRPHEQQTHYRTGVVNSGNTNQPQHVQPTRPHGYQTETRTYTMHGNSFPQQQRVHPTHPHTRTESMSTAASHKPQHAQQHQQRVVRKEPQVKPINRYAPPDYMTIMYHPTPTLEDLGLTSYLDSPPSSPRARSPARETEMADSPPAQESPRRVLPAWDAPRSVSPVQELPRRVSPVQESPRRVLPAWDAPRSALPVQELPRRVLPAWDAPRSALPVWELPRSASPAQETSVSDSSDWKSHTTNSQAREFKTAISADKQSPETVSEAKKSTLNVTNQMSERHQTISNTQMNQHLATNVEPQIYVPSSAPRGWYPPIKLSLPEPASTESVIKSRSASYAVPNSKSVKTPDVNSTNSKGPGSGSTLAEKQEKRACNWTLIAEQYSTESRNSVNQEHRRDALYRLYNKDERQQTHTTKRHQDHASLPHSKQTFDQILAEQIARQAELKSNNNNSQAFQTGTNPSEKRNTCQKMTKTSTIVSIVNMDDLFGGVSPYSCWNQSASEDPRFS
ncbi:adhesive plaque matrix protein-like [Saccostrea echinata]|uniref:adhesive plaque matrix protein-like n=1 Tax=Saccostrea echinata TaxID=191078 RepID=UPI002A841B15|nr:adhesive plaque matrix protein-like [Saccostrea echinata]